MIHHFHRRTMVCWVCETLCSYICWFDNLMLRWNRSMLYTYMCWFDCNLAIFIKLDSGIGPNLLTWHPIISWSNSDDKKFCIKISNWAIAQDRIKQLPGPRSFIRFCWNRKFNFNVGTHMNVNLLEQLHFLILKFLQGLLQLLLPSWQVVTLMHYLDLLRTRTCICRWLSSYRIMPVCSLNIFTQDIQIQCFISWWQAF